MKKNYFLISIIIFMNFSLISEEIIFSKLNQYMNGENLIRIPDINLDPYNGISGNKLFCDDNGIILIYNDDTEKLYELNSSTYNIIKNYVFDFSTFPAHTGLYSVSTNYFFYKWTDAASIAIDRKTGIQKFIVNITGIASSKESYYDELTNIILFKGKNNELYCIENPSMDEKQNQKNYHNVTETLKLFESGEYAPHLTLDEDHDLYIDGIRYRWGTTAYETKKYICTLNQKKKYIRLFDRNDSNLIYYTIPENEEVESITYHPNGDWYFLTINWTTNMHTLWRIENTWDPEWREQWFKTHKAETSLQDTSSTIVTLNEDRLCKDNLRLRLEEAADSKVITTMQKGTKVKILKLGKAEVIDSINSNWVQVEVLKGGLDKDGNPIKTGTVGWCYGGYLE